MLGPDEIWITIAQGFAQHVNNNAEALRGRFVDFEGKRKIEIVSDDPLPTWLATEAWTQMVRDHVGKSVYDLLVCDFSTTTPIARTASLVLMMDSFKKYFDYGMTCICGIPQVTLLGTPEDWKEILTRIAVMSKYDLEWWTTRLVPICDGLVATAEGRPDLDFWKQIYSPRENYGGELITGWIANLFPYLREAVSEQCRVRNGFVRWPRSAGAPPSETHPLSFEALPTGISMAPFRLEDRREEGPIKKDARELVAGFVGITQDHATKALRPEIGWGMREGDRLAMILSDLAAGKGMEGPVDWRKRRIGRMDMLGLPADLIQVLDVFDGGLLFPQARLPLRMLRLASWKEAGSSAGDREDVILFASLSDGRHLGYRRDNGGFDADSWKAGGWYAGGWDVVITPRNLSAETDKEAPAGGVRVVARSIRELFERLYDAEGECYFDEPDFTVAPRKIRIASWRQADVER